MRFYFCQMALAAILAAPSLQTKALHKYPSRPIQLVNTSAEGGVGDFVARLIAEKLARPLGEPVNAENRPGASGITAARDVARESGGHHERAS